MNQTPSGARRSAARLLTVDATAERLSLSSKTVRRLIEGGELTATRIGRRVLISEDDLRLFLNQHRT